MLRSSATHQARRWLRDRRAPAQHAECLVPTYFFHLRDGKDILLDPEGTHLEGQVAIAETALLAARSLISDDALKGHISLECHIDVEDEGGKVVHCLAFTDAVRITGQSSN